MDNTDTKNVWEYYEEYLKACADYVVCNDDKNELKFGPYYNEDDHEKWSPRFKKILDYIDCKSMTTTLNQLYGDIFNSFDLDGYKHSKDGFSGMPGKGKDGNLFKPAAMYIRKERNKSPYAVVIYIVIIKGGIELKVGVHTKSNDSDKFEVSLLNNFCEKEKDKEGFKEYGEEVSGKGLLKSIVKVYKDSTEKILIDQNSIKEAVNQAIQIYEGLLSEIPLSIEEHLGNLGEDGTQQIIFTGAPGTGKTFCVTNWLKGRDNIEWDFVQFHASYDYTNFIEGLQPVRVKTKDKEKIEFRRVDGIFKAFCRRAAKEAKEGEKGNRDIKRFYFVIDEINRADLSKVFGELMYCLEEGHRGEDWKVATQYANLPTYYIGEDGIAVPIEESDYAQEEDGEFIDIYREEFFIPKNVYIIGTMNDIDRSVESIDFAMRRRFKWVEIKANEVMSSTFRSILKDSLGSSKSGDTDDEKENYNAVKDLCNAMINLNNAISGGEGKSLGLGEEFHIGPAYLKDMKYYDSKDKEKYKDYIQNSDIASNTKESRKEKLDKQNVKLSDIINKDADLKFHFELKFSAVWENRIEPLLREYCRGRSEETTKKLIEQCAKQVINYLNNDQKIRLELSNEDNGSGALNDKKTVRDYLESGEKQIIFTGAPGTGKTYGVKKWLVDNKKKYKFVQFHPSYDYTDFVEGLRPVEAENGSIFARIDGQFKAFCREAAKNSKTDYYFVIDEINRADLSKVFGELLFGLEDDKRGKKNHFSTQYSSLKTYFKGAGNGDKWESLPDAENVFWDEDSKKEKFYVPENVHIIGMMNDIDRNVETIDFAMRRRFKWVNIKANDVMDTILETMLPKPKCENVSTLSDKVKEMNKYITNHGVQFGLSEAYHIGPAVLKHYDENKFENNTEKAREDVWKHSIEPTLREYCRGKNKEAVDEFINGCKEEFV